MSVKAVEDEYGFNLELGEGQTWWPATVILEEVPYDNFYDTVEETMKVSGLSYEIYANSAVIGTGTWVFGQNVTANGHSLTLSMLNDGDLLFSKKGTLYLQCYFNNAKNPQIKIQRGNLTETLPLLTDSLTNSVAYNQYAYVEIPNDDLSLTGVVVQGDFDGSHYITVGCTKYGYILAEDAADTNTDTKNIFELLQNFIGGFWENIFNKVSESIKPITNWVSSFWSNMVTRITSIFQPLFDYISAFWDNITEKLDYLRDQIVSIFVPDDEYFQNWLQEQYDFLVDKFGALGYLQSYVIDLFNAFYNAEFGEPVLTCPSIELDVPNFGHFVIMEEKEVNLNELTEGFDVAVDMLRFATSAIYCFALSGYAMKIKDEILR